jgi:RNA recognition motif-containing protein
MEEQVEGKRLYVGNLNYRTTDEGLKEHFGQAGTVEDATVITDKGSGRSKGFGFVEMSTPEEALKAIEMLNEKEFDERPLRVSIARAREERTDSHNA